MGTYNPSIIRVKQAMAHLRYSHLFVEDQARTWMKKAGMSEEAIEQELTKPRSPTVDIAVLRSTETPLDQVKVDREYLLALRLQGLSYGKIAEQVHISRQRVYQLLVPPLAIRKIVWTRAGEHCEHCRVPLAKDGHVHHRRVDGLDTDDYQDVDNLEYLCPSCHYWAHGHLTLAQRQGWSPQVSAQHAVKQLMVANIISSEEAITLLETSGLTSQESMTYVGQLLDHP